MEHLILGFLLLLFIVFSGFLSGSETSLFSLSTFTLRSYRNDDDPKKRLVFQLLQNPRELLVTIMMLNICSNILVQNVISSLFGASSSGLIKVGLPLILTLLFGEIIPKSLALPNNTKISTKVAPFLSKVAKLLGPVRSFLTEITSYISRFLFFFLQKGKPISVEELEGVLKDSQKEGVMDQDEVEIMKGYLELRYATVRELMRPKDEILYYDLASPINELEKLFVEKKCSRLPICEGNLEKVIGILSTRRYLFSGRNLQKQNDLRKIVKKPFFVPESSSAWSLFQDLREKKESLAMVVNEYGSITGLITQEDLLEAVIGEIQDPRDEKKKYTRSGEDVIIASGKLEISEMEDLFRIELKMEKGPITIGGWLIEQLGEIPKPGTRYVTDDFLFYVLAADPNRITRVYIRNLKPKKKRGIK